MEFKRQLISLSLSDPETPGTCLEFFAHRVPIWQGERIEQDARGQQVRGVLNVRETLCKEYPRWIPVDANALGACLAQIRNGVVVDVPDPLIPQIGDILYTVRNNLFHGCKGSDDSNDEEVLRNALVLLRAIVDFYIDWQGQPEPDVAA
jgi:hypothetical protein